MNLLSIAFLHRRAMWAVVALALLTVQTLGQLHRVAHVPQAGGSTHAHGPGHDHVPTHLHAHSHSHEVAPAHDHGPTDAQTAAAPGAWWMALFGEHDEHGCDAYDHVSHGDALRSAAFVATSTSAARLFASCVPAGPFAAQAAGYLARGPPASA
jgi:hypothetical protein